MNGKIIEYSKTCGTQPTKSPANSSQVTAKSTTHCPCNLCNRCNREDATQHRTPVPDAQLWWTNL